MDNRPTIYRCVRDTNQPPGSPVGTTEKRRHRVTFIPTLPASVNPVKLGDASEILGGDRAIGGQKEKATRDEWP
jgi:hypothetical protein